MAPRISRPRSGGIRQARWPRLHAHPAPHRTPRTQASLDRIFSSGKIRANFTLSLLYIRNYLESTHHVTSIKVCTSGVGGSTRKPGSSVSRPGERGKSSSNERLASRESCCSSSFFFLFPVLAGRGRRSSSLFTAVKAGVKWERGKGEAG